jgi:putative DNA primase/helicase
MQEDYSPEVGIGTLPPSISAAREILKDAPDATFCTFKITASGGKKPRTKEVLSEEGVKANTPKALLYTHDEIMNLTSIPDGGDYMGLVMHNPIRDTFNSPEFQLVCIDVDTKNSPKGVKDSGIQRLKAWAIKNDCLREGSYSKKGMHIFLWAKTDSRVLKKYKRGDSLQEIEIFGGEGLGKKASVMLTGMGMSGVINTNPIDLFALFEELNIDNLEPSAKDKPEPLFPPIPTPSPAPTTNPKDWISEEEKAKQALSFIDNTDRDSWIGVASAIHASFGEGGFQLFNEWSSTSSSYKGPEDCWKTFNSFKNNQGPTARTMATYYKEAMQYGWHHPNKGKKLKQSNPLDDFKIVKNDMGEFIDPETGEVIDNGWEEIDYDLDRLEATDYLIKDFFPHSFSVLTGNSGLGKTTAMLPMALSAAGFKIGNSDLSTEKRRKVIYVAEDILQVKQSLYAYKKYFSINPQELKEWFILIQAERSSMEEVIRLAYNVEKHTINNERPWLILDTVSATLDIEDENSNSEGAKFIDALATHIFRKLNASISMISHAVKNNPDDNDNADPRGAGAFKGNVTMTGTFFRVGAQRFFRINKVRCNPLYKELTLNTQTFSDLVINRHGNPQEIISITNEPVLSTFEDRKTNQVNDKENSKQQKIKNIKDSASVYLTDVLNKNADGVLIKKGRSSPHRPKWAPVGIKEITLDNVFNECGATNSELKSEVKDYIWDHVMTSAVDGWNWMKMSGAAIIRMNI